MTKEADLNNETERLFIEIDRVISDPKERAELKESFTLLQQKFLFRWETARDLDMEERVVNIVMKKMQEIYLADNKGLVKNVVETVKKELGEYLAPWNEKLEDIAFGLDGINAWQISVNGLIKRMDERIEVLEDRDEDYDKVIKKLVSFTGWKNTIIRKAIVIIISVGISIILFFQVINSRLGEIEKILRTHTDNTEVTK